MNTEELYVWRGEVDREEFSIGVKVGVSFDTVIRFSAEHAEELFGGYVGKRMLKMKSNKPIKINLKLDFEDEQ